MQHNCNLPETSGILMDVLARSTTPLSVKEIVFEIFGKSMPNSTQRRINRDLQRLCTKGVVGKDSSHRPYRYYMIKKGEQIDLAPCRACGNVRNVADLNSEGLCPACSEMVEQTAPSHEVCVSDNKRVNTFFGVHEPINTVENDAWSPGIRKHVKFLRELLGKPVRVTTAKQYLHGVVVDVTADGYVVLQSAYGPVIVNSARVAAIEHFVNYRAARDDAYEHV
ncbi:MAG TPA: hypothetical protein PK659_09035 [Methanothrix sp.]|nr:hypothetical protein [Methanothrix sp.]